MLYKETLSKLIYCILVLTLLVTLAGIFSSAPNEITSTISVHGEVVELYGKGIYHNMSKASALDGIAQDIVTLCIALPALAIALKQSLKGGLKAKLALAGVLIYFLFTYLLYMVLVMYNVMFLAYVAITSLSFFALALVLLSIEREKVKDAFDESLNVKYIGGTLVVLSAFVGMNWLSIILPPLVDGTVIPSALGHQTTLPVQGLDLAIMLPMTALSGILLIKKNKFGYFIAPIWVCFVNIMMIAIAAKIVGEFLEGNYEALPIVIVFLVIVCIISSCTRMVFKSLKNDV